MSAWTEYDNTRALALKPRLERITGRRFTPIEVIWDTIEEALDVLEGIVDGEVVEEHREIKP